MVVTVEVDLGVGNANRQSRIRLSIGIVAWLFGLNLRLVGRMSLLGAGAKDHKVVIPTFELEIAGLNVMGAHRTRCFGVALAHVISMSDCRLDQTLARDFHILCIVILQNEYQMSSASLYAYSITWDVSRVSEFWKLILNHMLSRQGSALLMLSGWRRQEMMPSFSKIDK